MTYELSLMDPSGELRRVEVDYSKARQLGQDITDGSHEGIRKVADGWATSLTSSGRHLARGPRRPRHRPDALSGDQGQWREDRRAGRQLGHRRLAQAR
jgi:hypothetical protein